MSSEHEGGWLEPADLALGDVREIASRPAETYRRRPPHRIAGRADDWLRRYSPNTVRIPRRSIYVFHDVYALRRGGVMRRDGTPFRGTLHPRFLDAQGRLKSNLQPRRDAVSMPDEPLILAANPGARNFGHWLVDTLPRVAWARSQPGLEHAKVMIFERQPAVDLLSLIGVAPEEIIEVPGDSALCPTLIYPSMWGFQPHSSHASETFDVLDRVRASVPASGKAYPRKVFLGRDDARNRFLTNESDLLPSLRAAGYEKVNAGFLNLAEQIQLFANALSIIAISGAALANMVFCDARCRIINISPDSMGSIFFWDLAHHKATPYSIYYGQSADTNRKNRSDLTLDVEDFLAVFANEL